MDAHCERSPNHRYCRGRLSFSIFIVYSEAVSHWKSGQLLKGICYDLKRMLPADDLDEPIPTVYQSHEYKTRI
jgi:hypothetical protein